MTAQKKTSLYLPLSIIVFFSLTFIGLFYMNITLHEKLFKTLLIFIFDIVILFTFILSIFIQHKSIEKKPEYFLYFLLYILFITMQFVITYMSGEVSYDRYYHYGNYLLLIAFASLVYLSLNNVDEIKYGLILINIFFIIITVWCFIEFFDERIISTIRQLYPNLSTDDINGSQKSILLQQAVNKFGYLPFSKVFANFRPQLSFGNTNYFAGYIIGLMPLLFVTPIIFYNSQKKFFKNYLSIITAFIALVGIIPLIFTQTRAAQFGWFIGGFLLLFISLFIMAKKIPLYIKIAGAISMLVIFVIIPVAALNIKLPIMEKIFPRLVNTMANFTFELKDRINGWQGGLGLFFKHPVFGAGLGTVYAASFKYSYNFFLLYSTSNSFKHSHSEYVELLGESGIIGLLFFIALFGFVVVMLLRQAYSAKYYYRFRVLSLAAACGIISMLLLQFFCLSLRMSVTMSAYFFLIGLGIFLISYKNRALSEELPALKGKQKSSTGNTFFLKKPLSKNGLFITSIAVLTLIIAGYLLFIPLYKSEYNIIKYIEYKKLFMDRNSISDLNAAENYLNDAINIVPDNVYAWTEKWELDFYIYLQAAYQNNEEENAFARVEKDLNTINKIIPGYQEVYTKYATLYIQEYDYYLQKYDFSRNPVDLDKADESRKLSFDNLNKSLDMNFLDLNNHLYRLIFLNTYNDREHYDEFIKDYTRAKIYLDFCRSKKVIRENVDLTFGDKNDLVKKDNKYYFTINNADIKKIGKQAFNYKSIRDFDKLQGMINDYLNNILSALYSKI